MKIYTKLVLSIESGAVVRCESYEYSGPLAECISGSGGKQKSKQKSQQTSESESGTVYNEDFMKRAMEFAAGKSKESFDAQKYLKDNPEVGPAGWDPYEHYTQHGAPEGRAFPSLNPDYNPAYVPSQYTGANFTSVAPEGFQKLEDTLYSGQKSKLSQAYNESVARQREELAQSGALNSPSQYLEGSARSALDKGYITSLQQAARDAFTGRFGMEVSEAGRRTAFDTGEAGRRTDWSTGEAGRQTGFNEYTAARLLDLWLKKLGIAIEAGRYQRGESQGTSSGQSSGLSGSGGIFQFGGSSSSS